MFKEESKATADIRHDLACIVGPDRFDLWLGDDALIECSGHTVAITLPSSFLRDSVHRHLGTRLQTAARELLGPDAKVVYVIAPTVVTEQVSQQDVSSGEPAEPVAVAPAAPSTPLAPSGLADTAAPPTEPPQTFQSLVVGASNELAAHAAQQVAAGRHTGAPLVIWGPAGCGKTHLLKALRYAYRQRFPRARILSLTAEQFLGHYVEALRGGGLPAFRMKYRGANLLLIDDVHFMGGKKATLEELHHTIDRVTAAGGQVVLTSLLEPGQIDRLGDELLSRLRAGLVCETRPADFATRLELARRRAEQLGLAIDTPSLRTIATGVTAGAREIIGTLHRLQAKHELLGEAIDSTLVTNTVAEISQQCFRPMGIDEIESAVCSYYGVEPKVLRSTSRAKSASQPRMLAMWLARKYTQAGWREIGDYFGGRSHSTVISAHRRIEAEMQADTRTARAANSPALEDAVLRIESALRSA